MTECRPLGKSGGLHSSIPYLGGGAINIKSVAVTMTGRSARWTRVRKWLGKEWTRIRVHTEGVTFDAVARSSWGVVFYQSTRGAQVYTPYGQHPLGGIRSMLRKRQKLGQDTGETAAASMETKAGVKYKPLLMHLALLKYHDGEKRVPGRLTIEVKGAMWTALLTDPDSCGFLRVSAPTFEELLVACALLVDGTDTPWEYAKWLEEPEKKSRKK